jgi:hypothetical protein
MPEEQAIGTHTTTSTQTIRTTFAPYSRMYLEEESLKRHITAFQTLLQPTKKQKNNTYVSLGPQPKHQYLLSKLQEHPPY